MKRTEDIFLLLGGRIYSDYS